MRRELREDLAYVPYKDRVRALEDFDADLSGYGSVDVTAEFRPAD